MKLLVSIIHLCLNLKLQIHLLLILLRVDVKSKSITSKDAMLLEEIKEFNDATNRALDNSFDTLTTTNLKWIVTRIAAKYSIFDNIFFGRRFN